MDRLQAAQALRERARRIQEDDTWSWLMPLTVGAAGVAWLVVACTRGETPLKVAVMATLALGFVLVVRLVSRRQAAVLAQQAAALEAQAGHTGSGDGAASAAAVQTTPSATSRP